MAMNPQSNEPIPPMVLQHRLDVGLGIPGGTRGSLTKVATAVKNSPDAWPSVDLELSAVELSKLILIVQRNEREIANYQSESSDIPMEDNLDDLRAELASLQTVQSCLQEYEALAKITILQQKTSESSLHTELETINATTQKLQEDLQKVNAACRIRQSQFQALQCCVQDLKSSLEEPLELQPNDLQESVPAESSMVEDTSFDADEKSNDPATPMQVDEEEGELYGDL